VAATGKPWYRRVFKPIMVEEANPPKPFVSSVLNLQRMLYENETDYIEALEQAWTSSVALRGFLLDGSLGDSTLTRDSFTREIESNRPITPQAGQFVLPSNFAPQ
jgi:hypothetical protein